MRDCGLGCGFGFCGGGGPAYGVIELVEEVAIRAFDYQAIACFAAQENFAVFGAELEEIRAAH